MIEQKTLSRAYSWGAVAMCIWCGLMLVVGETGAAAMSWVLGVICVFSARERNEI